MSITRVQGKATNSAGSVSSQAATLTSGVTSGNLLVAAVACGSNTTTITWPSGWTQATINQPAGANATIETSIGWAIVGAGGITAGQTSWTWTFSASHTVYLTIEEWNSSTGWLASPVDATANGDTSGAPTQATTIVSGTTATTAQATELWVASLAYKGSAQTESSVTAGWTSDLEATLAANNTMTMLYKVASSTGTAACQYSIGTTQYWAGCVVTFKPASSSPGLSTSPTSMTFNATTGGANPASQGDTLAETNGVGTAWTSGIAYGSGSGWLAISPTSGTLTANGTAAITVTCTTGALTAATYTATVTFTATTGGATATIAVSFTVAAAASFTLVQSQATASTGLVSSLSATVPTGITSGNLMVATVSCGSNATTISGPAGWAQAVINQPGNPVHDEMSIWYLVAGAGQAGQTSWTWTLSSPHNLYVIIEEWHASTGWPATPLDKVAVGNTAASPSPATTISSGTTATTSQASELWIGGLIYNGGAQTESSLTSGWTEDLEISDSAPNHTASMLHRTVSSTGTASVSFVIGTAQHWAGAIATFAASSVSPSPGLAVAPLALSLLATHNGANPASQSVTLTETNGASTNWTSGIAYISGSGWLSVAPTSGALTATGAESVAIMCTTGALTAGVYTAIVTFTASTGGASATARVTFTVTSSPLSMTIAGLAIGTAGGSLYFLEDTFQIKYTLAERWQATFTVVDELGTTWFTYRDLVVIQDTNLGTLYTGFLSTDSYDMQNTYPSGAMEHQITCMDLRALADKRTSNLSYTTATPAGKVVVDMGQQVLSSEGVIVYGAALTTTTQADWAAGTLSSVVATSNIGSGDLELTGSGSSATQSELTQASWSSNGSLSNVTANSGGDLSLHGSARNWNNTSVANQTLFGLGSPTQSASAGNFVLTCTANSETRSRLDFAGTWADFTATIDMGLGGIIPFNGLVYRTTGWSNNDSTYAYAVEANLSIIQLKIGSNGGAVSSATLASHSFSPTLSAGNYTLKIITSGNNHQVFLNGTQYINYTQSGAVSGLGPYTSAGSFAIRNRNLEGFTLSEGYDNFGVMASTSGTWTGNSVSVTTITTVASSVITWDTSLSAGGTVTVQATTNGGSTWTTCANGGSIPGLAKGASGTGKSLQVRAQLSTSTAAIMPDIQKLSWAVTSGYASTGTRTSGPFSLSSVGQCGSTFIGWNANLPTSTSLVVQASPDNSTWYDVTSQNGGMLPWINGTPDPTTDGFEVDTSANYTSTNQTGGGASTWTIDTAHSRITGTGGTNGILYYNALATTQNVDALTILDRADSGGLVVDFVDASNFYLVVVSDSQASLGTPNTVTFYKVSSGTATQLGQASVSFQRGTYHVLRATVNSGVITVHFDGNTIITYSDGSPLAAGFVGLWNNAGSTGSRYYYLWIQPQGDSLAGQVVYTKQILATSDSTVTPQLLDLTVAAFGPQIDVGATLPSASYIYTFCDKNMDDLAKQSNYEWWIDQNYIMNFNNNEGQPAPWCLQSNALGLASDIEVDTNLHIDVSGDQYRNRQILTNVINSGSFTDTFVGDGSRTSFTLRYPVAPGTVPTITLDTLSQKIGTKGGTGAQWYYAESDPTIAEDSSGTVLTSSNTLSVSYTGLFSDTVIVNNGAAQTALAIIDNTTGIVEAVEDVSQKNMTYAAALVYGQALLERFCVVDVSNTPTGRTLTVATFRNGLAVGQFWPVFFPEVNLQDALLLIHEIVLGVQTQPGNTVLYNYLITASELPKVKTFPALLATNLLT